MDAVFRAPSFLKTKKKMTHATGEKLIVLLRIDRIVWDTELLLRAESLRRGSENRLATNEDLYSY